MHSEILNDQISLQVEDKYLLKIHGSEGKTEFLELFERAGVFYTRPAFCPAASIPQLVAKDLIGRYGIVLDTDARIFDVRPDATTDDFLRKYWHRDRNTDEIVTRREAITLETYIAERFNGSQAAFAAAQGVKPPQVTQWLNKDFIVVDDMLYSPRRELK